MSKNHLNAAVVYEVCPICGKKVNDFVIMNRLLIPKYAKEVGKMNGKPVGFSKNACEECSKHKDECIYIIGIDSSKSDSKSLEGLYRTGQIVGIRKDFKLFVDHPEMIITTDNGVQFCFIDKELGKQIGFFK